MIKLINHILIYLPHICSGRIYPVRVDNGKGVTRTGQTTVEYLLMLAVIVAMVLILFVRFHKQMLGGFFSIVGAILGAGTPKT